MWKTNGCLHTHCYLSNGTLLGQSEKERRGMSRAGYLYLAPWSPYTLFGQENGPLTHKRTRTDFKLGEDMGIDLNEHISELQHSGINGSEDTTKRQISLLKLLWLFWEATASFSRPIRLWKFLGHKTGRLAIVNNFHYHVALLLLKIVHDRNSSFHLPRKWFFSSSCRWQAPRGINTRVSNSGIIHTYQTYTNCCYSFS